VALRPGVACTIMVADCLPVLFAHRGGQAVGAAHAGWRGLAGTAGRGVLESAFEHFGPPAHVDRSPTAIESGATAARDTLAQNILVWLGPCIGPQAFEVGEDVRAAFVNADAAAQACFEPIAHSRGKYWCDLAGLARQRLQALGIARVYGNDSTPAWCTSTNASRFFSHRRDAGTLGASGRMAVAIWLG
jgi:copper oxidase (laccase) domain-containing protein